MKKLYAIGVGVFAGTFLIRFAIGFAGAGDIGHLVVNVLGLALSVVFGMNGNTWRERNLLSRGFALVGTISAATPDETIATHVRSLSPLPVRATSPAL